MGFMLLGVVVVLTSLHLTLGRISSDQELPSDRNKVTGCPAEFQGSCRCGVVPYGPERVQTYVTNCTNAAFEDSIMLQHVPIETEVLIFVGNDLYDLHFNIFGRDDSLGKLHTVDLSDNHIQTIKGRTFHNVNSVRKLILNDNDLYMTSKDFHPRVFSNFMNLEELEMRNAFSDKDVKDKTRLYLVNIAETFKESALVNLKKLDLSENGLVDFKNDSFQSLPALEKISLRSNKLTNFDVDLSVMPHLKYLDLSNNNFPYLRRGTLARLSSVPGLKLNLSRNPLRCDCRIRETYHFLSKSMVDVSNKEDWRCYEAYPSDNVGKSLFEIDPRDLQCELRAHDVRGRDVQIPLIYFGFICLGLVILTITGVCFYRNRREVHSLALRVAQPVRNRFNYSSLDKKDLEAEMEV